MQGRQLSEQRCLRTIRQVVPKLQMSSGSNFPLSVRCWMPWGLSTMSWASTKPTILSVLWIKWQSGQTFLSMWPLSAVIKTWFSWRMKTPLWKFPRKGLPSSKNLPLPTSWKKWASHQHSLLTSKPSWEISLITFLVWRKSVKRQVWSF